MTTTTESAASASTFLGRDEELRRLRELTSMSQDSGRALVLLGNPGMGKTALLAIAAREARSAGMRLLAATGRESEQGLAFAGLHQLLRPVLNRIDDLPARQAGALSAAFGLSGAAGRPDAFLAGMAVLTLLSGLADEVPLLVTADDIQWMDQPSVDALAFAASRLDADKVALLLSARGPVPPSGLERGFRQLMLEPLSLADAGRLLDAQPLPPYGQAREQVLAQAAGNPLALIELARVIASDPDAGRRWAAEPVPLTSHLTAIMAARSASLPRPARKALLLAAAADSPDLAAQAASLHIEALAPAEEAGLIRVDASGLHFTHPLVRSAVYYGAPFAERAAAHVTIAEKLRGIPDRYAWHLAAAALGPDEHVAALLEGSAADAQRRGGTAVAARAMERAAMLSPDERDKGRRLLAAAHLAHAAGQSDWVRELAVKVLGLETEPSRRVAARLLIGWSLVWSDRHAEALETLLSVAAETRTTDPAVAWEAVGVAATVVHQTGVSDAAASVRAALDDLNAAGADIQDSASWPASRADECGIWIRACTDPFGSRQETVPALLRLNRRSISDLSKVGAAAWSLDETELAVQVLRNAVAERAAPGVRGASGAVLSCLAWAYADSGRWDEALATAREASDMAAAYRMAAVAANADIVTATILAMRGEHELVPALLTRVFRVIDENAYRGFAARARHAGGLAALGQGHYVNAGAQLGRHFGTNGSPLHYHFSYYAIADYAAASARAGRVLEAKGRIERALAMISPAPGPRMEQLVARARGLLAEPLEAERYFAAGLADPAGETWPFERAQLQLDYGEWLRRQRRINDAKPVLRSAFDTFTALGAVPWTERADSELRACGVPTQTVPAVRLGLDKLTPQQREIAILASEGMTNSEIAERLFLSPRTVASHLHRSYPKLGIAGRYQLRGVIDQAGG